MMLRFPQRTVSPGPAASAAEPGLRARFDQSARDVLQAYGRSVVISPLLLVATGAVAILTISTMALGPLGALACSIGLGASVRPILRGATRRVRRREIEQLPEICASIARACRSGYVLENAVRGLDIEHPPAMITQLVAGASSGEPFEESLRLLSQSASAPAERTVASALLVAHRSGGNAANSLDLVASELRELAAHEDRKRALTAQSRTSIYVLVLLPVAFGLVASTIRGESLYTSRAAVAAASIGVVLNVTGFVWMNRMMKARFV